MTCSACEGLEEGEENCRACKGTGEIVIADRCPLQVVTPEAWQMLDLASWMKEGMPPIAGGTLRQTISFMQSFAFIRRIQHAIEMENRQKK
jgi:DnaJ-class molecular chaperone